jgi:4'-phosphopantetheinyl transferase
VNLSPHAWDPREDPTPWLRSLLPARQELPLARLPQQPPVPAPGLPPQPRQQPQLPPLLLRLDRPSWPLTALAHSPLLAWLTAEECEHAERLRRPQDRERHLLGRAGLRRVLGAWRRQEPQRVPLRTGPHGKPFCPGGPHFNISHSGDLVLLALHPHGPVGVDVEQLRPELDWRPLAARLLCAAECRLLEGLPAPSQTRAFLQAWCRLEARLKATGQGLAGLQALRRRAERAAALELGPGAERGARPWAVARGPHGGARASGEPAQAGDRLGALGLAAQDRLWDLELPAGYCGALACLQAEVNGERQAGERDRDQTPVQTGEDAALDAAR